MELKIGVTYWMNILSGKDKLTFTGKIVSIDKNFVTFIDKFQVRKSFNLNNFISFEKITEVKE